MNLIAVQAAKKRANYIKDKYYYGKNCNTCKIEYLETAMLDFKTFCYDVCSADNSNVDTTGLSSNSVITCTNSIDNVTEEKVCSTPPVVYMCGKAYVKYNTNNIEDNDFIYEEIVTNDNTLYFTISNFTFNSKIYLNQDITLKVDSSNVSIKNISGTNFIMNLINYFDRFNLLDFNIKPTTEERDQIQVTTRPDDTWSIITKANNDGDSLTRGVILTNEGVQSVQSTVGGSYVAVGSLTGDLATDFQAGTTNLINFKNC